MSDDFYRRLDEKQEKDKIERIFKDRPENLHDYQGCVNDPAHLRQRIEDLEKLQTLHLDALRRVSAALGNPFAGDMTKSCVDLGLEVSRHLTETRKDAAEQSRAASQLADALLRKDEELAEDRRLAVSEDDQQAVRMYLWLNHGHHMMYGDDGEMQCVECMPFGIVDYKREPFSKVVEIAPRVRQALNLKEASKNIYQGGPDGPMEGM